MPRYQRRSERVDEAILGVYLSGTKPGASKGRWPRCCVGPAVEGRGLAPRGSARGRFRAWRRRDLAEDQIQYLVMDGWYRKSALASGASACRCS